MRPDIELQVARLLEAGDLKAIANLIEAIPGATTAPLPVSGHRLILWREARLHHIPKLTTKLRALIYFALNTSDKQVNVTLGKSGKSTSRRLKFYNEQGGRCYYCQEQTPFGKWTLDHLTPRSRGGGNRAENLRGSCTRCNGDKADQTEAEYRARLSAPVTFADTCRVSG